MPQNNVVLFPENYSRPTFNRERLREARLAACLSQTDLAKLINVSAETISNLESGQRQPGAETLADLCEKMGYPLSYFSINYADGAKLDSAIFFRSYLSKTKKQNCCLDVWRKRAGILLAHIGRYVNLPKVNLPDANWTSLETKGQLFEEAESLAQECRRAWGIGNGPIANLTRLAESKGVCVVRLDLPDMEDVDGFSCWQDGRPMIFLLAKKSAARERLNLAHELLHLIAHRQVPVETLEDKIAMKTLESQAFAFAGALSLPLQTYGREVYSHSLSHFIELKRRWGISIAAQGKRCSDLGIFDEDRYLQFRKNLSWNRYLKVEPLDDALPHEETLMMKQAVEMLDQRDVVKGWQIADSMGLPPEILKQITNLDAAKFEHEKQESALIFSLRGGEDGSA